MTICYSPLGANLTQVDTSPLWALGQRAYAPDDQQYVYCLASGAITQYDLVAINTSWTVGRCTTTLAGQGNSPGWAQVAIADGSYGWVAVHGADLIGLARDNVAANAQLYATPSAGKMTATASTGNPLLINGARSSAAAASGGGQIAIIATYPSFSNTTKPAGT